MPNRTTRSRPPARRPEPVEGTSDSAVTDQSFQEISEAHQLQSSPPDTRSRVDSTPTSPPSPPEVTQPDPNPFPVLPEDPDYDTFPYPYPRYTDDPDAESHIRAFVSTWQVTVNISSTRIRWVYNQEDEGITRLVIRFGANVLREQQRGYAQVKREMCAIVSMVEVDKDYLIGAELSQSRRTFYRFLAWFQDARLQTW